MITSSLLFWIILFLIWILVTLLEQANRGHRIFKPILGVYFGFFSFSMLVFIGSFWFIPQHIRDAPGLGPAFGFMTQVGLTAGIIGAIILGSIGAYRAYKK